MEIETPVEYEAAKRILELLDFRVKENLLQSARGISTGRLRGLS